MLNQQALERRKNRKYIDMCFKRCLQTRDVENVIIFDHHGLIRRSTINETDAIRYAGLLDELLLKTKRAIESLNNLDEFVSMRIRSRKFEILITKDNDLYFVVFQNACGKFFIYCDRKTCANEYNKSKNIHLPRFTQAN